MIGRKDGPSAQEEVKPKGFDDFELRLGDVMRGERATLAKSLLDVQRELRIKASHIAAIEACDVDAFETPSFIAGYVRSYARYLGMDPDWAFERFCKEAGFTPTHGMAAAASGPKRARPIVAEPLADPNASFVPRGEAFWTKIEPRAVGSVLVLLLLASGIGYGGWSVLQEVQRVQLAPVDQVPGVLAELDPLQSVRPIETAEAVGTMPELPSTEALDRIYRPAALEVPKLVSRDGPIAAIDPNSTGVLAGLSAPTQDAPVATAADDPTALASAEPLVRALGEDAPEVEILAVRPSWVRIVSAEGTVIFEKVLDAGERYALPRLEQPPVMRTGESGAIYFAVNGVAHGPAGARGEVTKNITLSPEALSQKFAVADLGRDADLASMIAVADAGPIAAPAPEVLPAPANALRPRQRPAQ
ncbi:helix-turn-helix domain-containing protein [Pseudothioclava arenosa]|uniref:Helix-turn-helix domain-containing protein n=1 Tax=Pseudothioclava arenosa TaxID=1795308 RepID=A0A2A4CNS9_9RHOB|nr:helix-turn-helix domain-containing protein [Pseudothioclava arenosa]PCD77653.1 helix-turn-helix domain-containing protein [Pseudothioclava arenosa]